MPGEPLVSVLISAYNDMAYLPEALDSILSQTLGDFELIVVDDGSTDGAWHFLQSLRDGRMRLVRNERNIGLTRSLNLGLDLARGRYLARMDADDVSDPSRLARQVEFLENTREVGIVGTSRVLIDEQGKRLGQTAVMSDNLGIRWKCLLGNPFAHPTVMIRQNVLRRYALRYDPAFRTAQDYELWVRLLQHTRGANLNEPLLRYRMRAGISRIHHADQLQNHDRISASALRAFIPGSSIDANEVTGLRGRFGGFSVREADMRPNDATWVERYLNLLDAFSVTHASEADIEVFQARQKQFIAAAAAA